MRKWHRWLVIFSGVFLAWIAATGLVGQVISLAGAEQHEGRPAPTPAPAPVMPAAEGANAIAAPADDGDDDDDAGDAVAPIAKKHEKKGDLYHLIIDLHSGAYFGPAGKVLSALLGAAMLFFSLSGIWMYIDMFRKRKRIGRTGIFWK